MIFSAAGVPNMSQAVVSLSGPASNPSNVSSLLYSASLLKEKLHQLQSVIIILVSHDHHLPTESTSIAMANMGSLVQEIILTASSLMITCQQMRTPPASTSGDNNIATNEISQLDPNNNQERSSGEQGFYNFSEAFDTWYCDNNDVVTNDDGNNRTMHSKNIGNYINKANIRVSEKRELLSEIDCDIIELDAGDLLAKYTHYCKVCGEGFKRDANLRMHMRAHGDEYKTSAALTNRLKKNGSSMG